MRRLFAVSLLALVITCPAVSAPAPKESWGKPGITLDQYRQDSVDCGLYGYYTDISKTEDAKAFVNASRQLDAVTTGGMAPSTTGGSSTGPASTDSIDQAAQYAATQQRIVANVRPEERFHSIKQQLVSKTEQCLMVLGYSKFALTEEQRHALRKMKAGSEQRREYLYSLASNPAVLQSQKIPAQP